MTSEDIELNLEALLQEWAMLRPDECRVVSQRSVVLFMHDCEWSISLDFNTIDQAKLQFSLQERIESRREKAELNYDIYYQVWIAKVALGLSESKRTSKGGTIYWARGEAKNKVSALAFLAAYVRALQALAD